MKQNNSKEAHLIEITSSQKLWSSIEPKLKHYAQPNFNRNVYQTSIKPKYTLGAFLVCVDQSIERQIGQRDLIIKL